MTKRERLAMKLHPFVVAATGTIVGLFVYFVLAGSVVIAGCAALFACVVLIGDRPFGVSIDAWRHLK